MEAVLDAGRMVEMLVQGVDVLQDRLLPAHDKIVDDDDVLRIFRESYATNVLSRQGPKVSGEEEKERGRKGERKRGREKGPPGETGENRKTKTKGNPQGGSGCQISPRATARQGLR